VGLRRARLSEEGIWGREAGCGRQCRCGHWGLLLNVLTYVLSPQKLTHDAFTFVELARGFYSQPREQQSNVGFRMPDINWVYLRLALNLLRA